MRRMDSSESCDVYEMRNILSDWYCEVAYELDSDSAIQALSRACSHLPGMRPLVRSFQDAEAMTAYRPRSTVPWDHGGFVMLSDWAEQVKYCLFVCMIIIPVVFIF